MGAARPDFVDPDMGTALAILWLSTPLGTDSAHARGSERVIHRFDFNERPEGNLEEYPKYWERVRHLRFPLFTSGGFDFSVGHAAPPSFHLASQGRDVAFAYLGPAARVEPGKRFRIEGFIRPDQLNHGRACLSAAYRRGDGTTLLDTLVRSAYVGGGQEGWQTVELYLPQAPAEADAIVLTAWVLQEATWNATNRTTRDIDQVDVDGGAWFDDMVVIALPRIDLRVGDGLNVVAPDDRAELQVIVDDVKLHELNLLLTIVDAGGEVRRQTKLTKDDFAKGVSHVPLSGLTAGVYSATLRVTFEQQLIDARSTRFAILAELPEGGAASSSFGIVLSPGERMEPAADAKLLGLELVRAAKVPLPAEGSPGRDGAGDDESQLLLELMKRGFEITAVLLPSPSPGADPTGNVAELLARDPSLWEGEVAATAARYAGTTRWWQLGSDGGSLGASAAVLETALNNVRGVLDRYALGSQLAAAWSMHEDLQAGPAVEGVTLAVDTADIDAVEQALAERRSRSGGVAIYARPLPVEEYARLPRLSEWVRRLLVSRHAGAETVYAPQTWTVRASYEGLVSEPTEEFVILRTIAGLIGGARPGPRVERGTVRMLAFYAEDSATLALWDDAAPPEGRLTALQLGGATHAIDPWGNREALQHGDDGLHSIRLSQMPVLVPGVESWLVDLLTCVSLEPARATPGAEAARHVLKIDYQGERPLAATVRVTPPPTWRASPATFEVSLSRNEPLEIPIELRRPHNEPSGFRQIVVEMGVEHPGYVLEIPIPFEIALPDVEVRGSALLVGDELVLRHAVRNMGSQQLHLRSAAAVPGRQRQYRPIVNLEPGESETVEYHFRDSADLSERQVYLTLRELNDGPRSHTLQVVVP